jgi:N-acyl-D-amino-acid deacylase
MPDYDVVIKDGTIVDGLRMPRYVSDIGVSGGKIAKIGKISGREGVRTVDARGLIVAPGFVDLHTHYDAQLFWDPHCSISSWHGVTSVVIGNCGFGFAPVPPSERERSMLTMTRVEAIPLKCMQLGLPWDWVTYPEFLDSVAATPKGVNALPLLPAGPLMAWVMGRDEAKSGRLPTHEEHAEMSRLLVEGVEAGGCGWSAQRLKPIPGMNPQRDFDGTPMITDLMHDETALVLAEALGVRGEGFIQMTLITDDKRRDEQHMEELAIRSGQPVVFNNVIVNEKYPNSHRRQLAWLDRCRERGIRVYGQGFTTDAPQIFTFEDWNQFDDSDAWREATLGSIEERRHKLHDPGRRQGLKDEPPRALVNELGDLFVLKVYDPAFKKYEDLKLSECAQMEGKHPVDFMLDLAVAEDLRTMFYAPAICNDELMREVIEDPYVIPGVSDGGAHTKFTTGGRFPTETIVKWVKRLGVLSLEEVHWRLSALPAWCAGFRDRGAIQEGAGADIIVYDCEELDVLPMEVAEDLPGGEWRRVQRATGYRYILVNGEVTFEDGRPTGATPGLLLRHGAG